MKKMACTLVFPVALLALAGLVRAADATHGADVFDEECAECHSLKPGKNKKGPSLFGICGKQAGGVADFVYSDALAAASVTWNDESLDKYITRPRDFVAGGKMKYKGLPDAADRADLIEFLKRQQ